MEKFLVDLIGDNLIMLEKRGDGQSSSGNDGMDGFSGDELPPLADGNEPLPF